MQNIRRYSEHPTAARRGLQIWVILVGKAASRQTITYGEVSHILGWDGAGTMGPALGHVAYFCAANELPPLTQLVVNQKTGKPGEGMQLEDADAQREAVFGYEWFDVEPPAPEELVAAYAALHVA